jgi:hypothetical protein
MKTIASSRRRRSGFLALVLLAVAQVAWAASPCLQALNGSAAAAANSPCPMPDSDCCPGQCLQATQGAVQNPLALPVAVSLPAVSVSVRIAPAPGDAVPRVHPGRVLPPSPPIPIRNCSLLQ